MIRLAAVFGERRDAREEPTGAIEGAAVVVAAGFVAAWSPDCRVDSARVADVTCVAAGADVSASEVAAAYAGDSLDLGTLRGGFAVLLADERRRRALVATDRLGVLAPVLRRDGGRLLVALEVRDLLPLLKSTPAPDERSVVRWLVSGTTDPAATLYAGIERLPGGHALELADSRWARRRYHRFSYDGTLRAGREEIEAEVRSAVDAAVGRGLAGDGHSGVLLSGGLDSAVVAAAARRSARRLPSYSLVFPAHAEVDERPLIEAVAASLELEPHLVPYGGGELLPAAASFAAEWELPPASPTLAIQLPLLRHAADDGTVRLLDGQGGDELFGAPLYLLADRLRRARVLDAHALARRIPGIPQARRGPFARRALRDLGIKGALPHAAHRVRRPWTPPWLTRDAAARYRDGLDPWSWKLAPGPRWWAALLDAVTAQRERAGAHEYLRRRNALAGVEGAHPLLQDVDLIELVLRLPPELSFDPVYDRPLLRSAVAAVPDVIRRRAEKAYFTPLFVEAVDRHDAAAIRRLVSSPDAEIRAYADGELVREHLLDVAPERRGEQRAWALWRLAAGELWLRRRSGREQS